MNKGILCFLMSVTLITFFGCFGSVSKPSDQQIFEIIKAESVISKYNFIVLENVTIKSSTMDGKKFKALVNIEFLYNRHTSVWAREGTKDFFPHMSKVNKGKNSLDATAVFLKYDDGSWHLDGFNV